jgi:hypothetical protein
MRCKMGGLWSIDQAEAAYFHVLTNHDFGGLDVEVYLGRRVWAVSWKPPSIERARPSSGHVYTAQRGERRFCGMWR